VQLWRKTAYYIWRSSLPLHRKVHCVGSSLCMMQLPLPLPRCHADAACCASCACFLYWCVTARDACSWWNHGVSQVDILFCYFGIRKFATHWVSLGFFCMLVPLSTFTPEVRPPWCCARISM
jgi:hypothetical protein